MMGPISNGDPSNFAGLAGANMLTTTSQYAAVYLWNTTTADNFDFRVTDTTTAWPLARGINQTYFTSGASNTGCRIRLFGVSSVIGITGIIAGDFLKVGNTAGALTSKTAFSPTVSSVSTGVDYTILGVALQSVITTGAKFAAFINPSWTLQ